MNFRDLSGFPPLFIDYVEGVPPARSFLGDPPDLSTLVTRAAELRQALSRDAEINRRVPEQLQKRQSSPSVVENALRLSNPYTVVVLATAPAAVAGGALSVLLKCLTACRVAAALSSRGIEAVPVCWVGSGLCSLIGTESAWLLDSEAKLREISAADAGALSGEAFAAIMEQIAPGRQSIETLEFLRMNYGGPTLSSACCRFLSALTQELGLVAIDAAEPQFESMVAEKFESLAADASITAEMGMRREELRRAGYALPDHESQTGVLIPAVQSLLLPVAVQVCDPAEICFRAISEPLFSRAGLASPAAWPRASATLLDPRSRRFLNRHGLRLNELFLDRDELLRRILNEPAQQSAMGRFDALEKAIQDRLTGFVELVHPDDDLRVTVETSRGKMLYQIGKLKERFMTSIEARRGAEQRQLERACNTLAPSGQLQETILSTVHFLLRHTLGLVRFLYENLEFTKLEHQILSVD